VVTESLVKQTPYEGKINQNLWKNLFDQTVAQRIRQDGDALN
jgi:hypothetical protein